MSESVQNQYLHVYNMLGNQSNHQFAIYHSFPQENSYLNQFSEQEQFHQVQLDKFYSTQPLKNRIQITQPRTKYMKNQTPIRSQYSIRNIQFQANKLEIYKNVYRGTKDDTVELNINFKTIISNFLKELKVANQLNEFQLKKFLLFIKRVPSFKSLKELFSFSEQNQRLRQTCLQFVESGKFMRRVISSKCGLNIKLQMVKYVQKLGVNIKRKEIVKWKDELRYKQIL